jgi:glycosyltransferase involved in cell wall biosynthesis
MNVSIITPFLRGRPYHSKYSGYERLIDSINPKKTYLTIDFPRLSKLTYPFRMAKFMSRFYTSVDAEKTALRDDSDILHHVYGEDTFLLSGFKHFRKDKKIVVTFHQPPERFIKIMPFYWKRVVKNADCIIVLSPSQKDFFRKELGSENVFLIPHGIDTDYFSPVKEKDSTDQFCLAVGDHLRDYNTLIEAMKIAAPGLPSGFKLVIVSRKLKGINQENIILKSGITDGELLELYRRASFLVLPLKSATANNVLLEGMACGLPVVTNRLEDISYYTKDGGCLYYDGEDTGGLARQIIKIARSKDLQEKLGKEARKRAEELSWDEIARRTLEVYEKCD